MASMENVLTVDELSGHKYETIFCIFLVVLAFLFRENTHLAYPQVLYLFLILLILNLSIGMLFQRWAYRTWMGWGIVLGNGAIITLILNFSGGADSNLWVLYLLPIYTSCIFLNGIGVGLLLFGVIGCTFLFGLAPGVRMDSAAAFFVSLKTVVFCFATIAIWRVAQKNRKAREKILCQRQEVLKMEKKIDRYDVEIRETKKMADMGQIASGIAHDLKNPIAVILGTVNLLLEDESVQGTFRADLERMFRSAELCQNITSNVLAYSRTNEDSFQPCDLNEIVDAALVIYESLLAESAIRVTKKYTSPSAPVRGNPSELERIVLNLFSNARAAMKTGGELKVATVIVLSPDPVGMTRVELSVEDTGLGIPAETMARIFKPFNTTKPLEEGTGLGLYLCREIATRHKGNLNAENVPRGGAKFTLSLPFDNRTQIAA